MTDIKLDGVAIDCANAATLAAFYGAILRADVKDGVIRLNDDTAEIWFQTVQRYQPPTWPTQERGQQVHVDLAVPDVDAAVATALELGGQLVERLDGYHHPIVIDPEGHPICLFAADGDTGRLSGISLDCDDHLALATFYQQFLGGEIEPYDNWSNLRRGSEPELSFQHAEGYQPPTWPTQERGQQEHIDYYTHDRAGEVERAQSIGATLIDIKSDFTVLLDPAGHPFCICDED